MDRNSPISESKKAAPVNIRVDSSLPDICERHNNVPVSPLNDAACVIQTFYNKQKSKQKQQTNKQTKTKTKKKRKVSSLLF